MTELSRVNERMACQLPKFMQRATLAGGWLFPGALRAKWHRGSHDRPFPQCRATALPAHGPVTGSAHARIDELLAHHDTRLAECAAAVRAGHATAAEAAWSLRWTRHGRELTGLDPFNQMVAVIETRAHLELLTAQGRLTRHWEEGVARYQPAAAPPAPAAPPPPAR